MFCALTFQWAHPLSESVEDATEEEEEDRYFRLIMDPMRCCTDGAAPIRSHSITINRYKLIFRTAAASGVGVFGESEREFIYIIRFIVFQLNIVYEVLKSAYLLLPPCRQSRD